VTRRRAVVLAIVLVALGLFAEWAALQRAPLQQPVGGRDLRLAAADLATGWVLAGCGLIAWTRRPSNRIGALLTATSATWFLGTFADSGLSSYADFGALFVTLHRGPLFHAVLAYPDGRLRTRFDQGVVTVVYGTSAIASIGDSDGVIIGVAALVFASVLAGFIHASAPRRRALRAPLTMAGALAAVLIAGAVLDLRGASPATDRAVLAAYEVAISATALWFALGLLHAGWTQSTVTGLVIELGGTTGAPLRDRLANALGDSTVVVGYRVAGREGYVDADGHAIELPGAGDGREVTYVGGPDPVAVLVHDPGAIDDPALLEPVAAATRIAVSNVQLQSEIRDRLDELTRSRRRIVEAADAQRRRLEQQLRVGPQARLAKVAALLDDRRDTTVANDSMLAETVDEVAHARDELSEFARGIHPRILSDGGLDAALEDLAGRAAVPVDLSPCGQRFDAAIEAGAYFVCAEALANVGKYAQATSAAVSVRREGNRLTVSIADDGIGGANPSAGSGLRGLRDRVEALGGMLSVESRVGAGTRVVATLPLR
jgi:signal transduction histidine kinase